MFNLNLNTFIIALVASTTFAAAVPMALRGKLHYPGDQQSTNLAPPDLDVNLSHSDLNVRANDNILPDIGSQIGAGHNLPGAGTDGNSKNGTQRVANPGQQRGRVSAGGQNRTISHEHDDEPGDDDDYSPGSDGHDADEDYGEPVNNSAPDSDSN